MDPVSSNPPADAPHGGTEEADASSAPAEFIRLDQFLKVQRLVSSGGEAKWAVRAGRVRVNDEVELRRGRKLVDGDSVTFEDMTLQVAFDAE